MTFEDDFFSESLQMDNNRDYGPDIEKNDYIKLNFTLIFLAKIHGENI